MSVWPFPPQQTIKERIIWQTDVIRCKSAEQRVALRSYPRTEYEIDMHLDPAALEAATRLNELYSTQDILFPLWNEKNNVGSLTSGQTSIPVDTTNTRFQSGQKAFIIDPSNLFEIVDITTVGASSIDIASPYLSRNYTNAIVMPCYPFRINGSLQFTKQASSYVTATIQFISTVDFSITGSHSYTSYNSSYVMTDRPLLVSATDSDYREVSIFDNIAGPYTTSTDFNYQVSRSNLSWNFNTRAQSWAFREWLYYIKGKQGSFYAPRWTRDFIPSRNLVDVDTGIYVYKNDWYNNDYYSHICVVDTSGNMHFHKVDSITLASATEELLVLSSAVGYNLNLSNVEMICRMPKMRSNSDQVEFSYQPGGSVNIRMPIMEIPE